jgi:hypothetical protein
MRSQFLLVSILLLSTFAFSKHKVETLTGRIIAHEGGLSCFNGDASWSVIIRVARAQSKNRPLEFVRVNFTLPCGQFPEWFQAKSPLRTFRVTRDSQNDRVLEKFLPCLDESTGKSCGDIPIWQIVPGAENEDLPFGKTLPAYQFVDTPLKPATI